MITRLEIIISLSPVKNSNMKIIFTLVLALFSLSAFCQIDPNGGSTRDDHTTGIEKVDVIGSISTVVLNGQLSLKSLDHNIKIEQVLLYDMNGSLVADKRVASSTALINVSSYSSGIYFVSIKTNKETVAKKIFIATL